MKTQRIVEILKSGAVDSDVVVKGWVRTKRGNKNVAFIALNDGSCVANIQVVVDLQKIAEEQLKPVTTGACLRVDGRLVALARFGAGRRGAGRADRDLRHGRSRELPLQKKGHSLEFPREIAYLRPRTNTFGAVHRIRHAMAYAIHEFFHKNGFYYFHTPIITASDCEGAGAMFQVTTLDLNDVPRNDEGAVDYAQDFFGKQCSLTVSGQLEGELGALSLGRIYTFGPTFRAENSNTVRHASEFWMIEPEAAFYELEDNMELAEEFLKYLIRYAPRQPPRGPRIHEQDVGPRADRTSEVRGRQRLPAPRLHGGHRDPEGFGSQVRVPPASGATTAVGARALPRRGALQASGDPDQLPEGDQGLLHEAERRRPYRACDGRALPKIGEIIGGSEREADYGKLAARVRELGMSERELWWYLDTRRWGSAPHSGFGLGFDRLLMFVTGLREHPRRAALPAHAAARRILINPGERAGGLRRRAYL